ncbi:MAG: hypothetical protein ACYDEB_14235 [Dehalococcoidia bacterium]
MYMHRITIYANPEKVAELRALLIERTKARQAAGMRLALTEMVVGSHAPQFTVNVLFNDLAAFEASRKRDQADGDFQKFVAKLSSLIRKPSDFALLDVLLPMPT